MCGAGAALLLLLAAAAARAEISHQDCLNPANRIIAENCRPGNLSTHWDVNSDGDPSIQVSLALEKNPLMFTNISITPVKCAFYSVNEISLF